MRPHLHVQSTTAPARKSWAGRRLFALVLQALSLLVPVAACTVSPPTPVSVVVVCDATGTNPSAVCTKSLLHRAGREWASVSFDAPGSRLSVIEPGADFGSAEVYGPLVVTSHPKGSGPLVQRQTWERTVEKFIDTIPVTPDDAGNRTDVRSDLFGAFTVAVALASEAPKGGKAVLMVASDGLAINQNVSADFEWQIPSESDLGPVLKRAGLAPSLREFASITFCGFGSTKLTPELFEARAAFWRAYARAGSGPEPAFLSTCAGTVPLLSSTP